MRDERVDEEEERVVARSWSHSFDQLILEVEEKVESSERNMKVRKHEASCLESSVEVDLRNQHLLSVLISFLSLLLSESEFLVEIFFHFPFN